MIIISCSDESVIGGVHQVKDPLDLCCLHVDKGLWSHSGCLGFFFDLLAMFVCSGLESDIITDQSLVAGNGIGHDDLIGVSDVRFAAGIRYCGCNVILSLVFHNYYLPKKEKVPFKDVINVVPPYLLLNTLTP